MAAIPLIDIEASKRTPFDDSIPEIGVDYSSATSLMQIRAEPGDTGAPLISLGLSTGTSQGIAITYDPTFPDPETEVLGPASFVRIIINESTLESLALGADPSKPVVLYYDIHLTPFGGKKFVFAAGKFIISPGVSI